MEENERRTERGRKIRDEVYGNYVARLVGHANSVKVFTYDQEKSYAEQWRELCVRVSKDPSKSVEMTGFTFSELKELFAKQIEKVKAAKNCKLTIVQRLNGNRGDDKEIAKQRRMAKSLYSKSKTSKFGRR